ncbi:hypothetical protein C8A01DRAFT_32586 [Parachaetomium inaequale]|uniref:Uncharacterized protein n=1 Tax=Parachaetomium inaequale TaxID=2588326 RepID=A0AAN6PLK3_9PEZI|nr:hypothetical protein C8A01DRAFT_32586 [Parachaetomium inaequale]
MAPMPMPSWILKTPRVVLVIVFPLVSLILYLVLSLGCINDSVSGISPVIAQSNGPVTIGGQNIQVDIRVGFWGLCFGPAPFNCTTSLSPLQPKRTSQLAAEIPPSKGGGNFALAGLALGLQSSFVVLSGIPLLLLLLASVVANLVQIYVNTRLMSRERHAQAALWARSLDWAAAAGAVMGFAAYQAIVAAASRLIGTVVAGVPLAVSVGGTASNLFAAVVVVAVVGALVNTVLAAMDAGFDAYLAGKRVNGGGGRGMVQELEGRGMVLNRAAYERFP